MTATLTAQLGANSLRIVGESFQPAWARVLAKVTSRAESPQSRRVDLDAAVSLESPSFQMDFRDTLAAAAEALGLRPADLAVRVEAGMAHSRIAVLQLRDNDLSDEDLGSFANAWAAEVLMGERVGYELRWSAQPDQGHLVVMAVRSDLIHLTSAAVHDTGARLLECSLPALTCIGQRHPESGPAVLVWKEAGRQPPGGPIQLFRVDGRRLLAEWRGWISHATDGEQTQEAIARFCSMHGQTNIEFLSWPEIS